MASNHFPRSFSLYISLFQLAFAPAARAAALIAALAALCARMAARCRKAERSRAPARRSRRRSLRPAWTCAANWSLVFVPKGLKRSDMCLLFIFFLYKTSSHEIFTGAIIEFFYDFLMHRQNMRMKHPQKLASSLCRLQSSPDLSIVFSSLSLEIPNSLSKAAKPPPSFALLRRFCVRR